MSREGANNRIDSIKNSLNTDHYQRTALGSAVRFNTMLNLFDDFLSADIEGRSINENTGIFNNRDKKFSREEFASALETSINDLRSEFDAEIEDELGYTDKRFNSERSIQQKLENRAYSTALGQTVAHATVTRKGMYQDFNTSYSTGASGAFRSFTNGFVQDDVDYFGSRTLYDNVYGNYEDGSESLSNRRRLAMSDPSNDNRTVSEKALDNVVNRSIYDQVEIIDRVDIEFGRFHGNSAIDNMSMTGSGLKSARQTIRTVMQEGSAYGRQVALRGADNHPVVLAQALSERTSHDIETTSNALQLLNNNLGNRSSTTVNPDGGYVNKAGVAEFIDLINTAGTRDSNGSLTGGRISISSFQFQNETISAALSDKIQRHVLESVLQGGGAPLQIDMTLAYPRQRNLDGKQDNDGRYAVGMTNYGILGPNLIEAMKLQEVQNNIEDMLVGLGVSKEDISKYVNLNIEFRDKKFHPKVYFTDNQASIGTQNLTAPVGSSVNQAGSNFETMRFVTNSFSNDEDLQGARLNFSKLGEQGLNQVYNNKITQSLLYRQIVGVAEQEREFSSNSLFNRSQGNTSAPILNNKIGSQVGFAGDTYQHISNTLEFAHNSIFNKNSNEYKNLDSSKNLHMFMVLDQVFMLQLGSTSFSKQLKGEMGDEIGATYNKNERQAQQYQLQQNRLFDLLIADKASVVVDAKNYNEKVLTPLLDKINAKDLETGEYTNQKLRDNYLKYGQSLSMMAGFDLFKPSEFSDDSSIKTMFAELRRVGFTKEAGFDDSDLKQILGLASGNIEMANVPRQHAKMAALFQYDKITNSSEAISYYMGSSNMGLYSSGIGSGENGRYESGDGDLTNTEVGIMLGRRDINSNLSRTTSIVNMSDDFRQSNNMIANSSVTNWALNEEEEAYELQLAQRHFSTTWNQLARTNILNPTAKKFEATPFWQENVNTKDLIVLKNRLETMSKQMGLGSNVFTVTERFGDKSGSGIVSINVSINMNNIMTSSEYMQPLSSLPKLNFELSVLQGPSRGSGMFADDNNGEVPGYVYFVDKNRVVGNGLFTNDSGQQISVVGRKRYEDRFEDDINKGRVNLKSGQSAHMSSLDIVPQLFATLMGEAVNRFGTKQSMKMFDANPTNENMAAIKTLLTDYVAVALTGRANQMDESIEKGSNIISSTKQIQNNLNLVSLQDLNETINRHATSNENRMDSYLYDSSNPDDHINNQKALRNSLANFNNKWFHHLKDGREMSEGDISFYVNDLFEIVKQSPQLANMIVKTTYKDPNQTANIQSFKDFQSLLFGSFLQTKDERTYGGQQGFYKTLLLGVGNSYADKNTAGLMFDVDTQENSLRNLNAYARFKPLEYNPLTDIHDVLYRSIASKSTSLTKNDDRLDSVMFESEARDLGDSANLRLMSSIGIGNTMFRDDYIIRNDKGEIEVGKDQKEIFEAMERVMVAANSDPTAISLARQNYLDSVSKQFGDLDSEDRKDTIRLNFYTGSKKKLSQLPQRIKNAMGARPMYQFTVEAQMAMERGESLNELSDNYLAQYRQPLIEASRSKVKRLLQERENMVALLGEDHSSLASIDRQIDDLKIIGAKSFNNKISGLGAVFSGRIKSVLNQEQVDFITNTKNRLQESIGDLIEQGELSQDVFDELLRVEIIKAGLTNKGLGKMITGNNHMNYSMAFIQLSGVYNDTFLANPLYGTLYHSEDKYKSILKNETNIYDESLSVEDRDKLGIYNLGMKEGHFDSHRESIKSSQIGAGGMEVLLQNDDIIVEDKKTGKFVHKRKVNGEWTVVGEVDDSRNVQTVRNVVDRTGFSDVNSPTLGSTTTSTFGRKGENSIDYIYSVENRGGNFANNEYLIDFTKIRAIDPGSARRVEGTDSAALIKGVAKFAGRLKYNSIQNQSLETKEMNVFENIEEQIMKSYEDGEIKGSLKAYLDSRDETQRVTLQDGRTGYAPLSSSIHGLYNANNFKSFFWSHGATVIRAQNDSGKNFMLDSLFNKEESVVIDNAKKLAGALLVNFGTDFLGDIKDPSSASSITNVKRSLVNEMIKGSFGAHYQRTILNSSRDLNPRVDEIFNNAQLRKGRNRDQILEDLLYEKVGNQVGYNANALGALGAISSKNLEAVLNGDTAEAAKLLDLVRQGMLQPVADRANKVGGINFTNSSDRQAALIVTAFDLMQQISSQGSKLRIPSDIDFDSDKVKDILLTVMGVNKNLKDGMTDDLMEFLSGVESNVTTISVFTDIIFSYSKDPTSTQSVARHEGQHLVTPYLGSIKKYQEGGNLSNIQHTVASIASMVTGTKSGLVFYDKIAKSGFNERQAINLIDESQDYLFTSFHKQRFLGFYQTGVSGVTTDNFVKEYQSINRGLMSNSYEWGPIQTIRDLNDPTKLHDSDESFRNFDEDGKPGSIVKAHKQVERFVNKFYGDRSELEKTRLIDKYLMMGGDRFAYEQLDRLTAAMSIENAKYQADPFKSTGRDTTENFLRNMNNKQMFFGLPELSFEMQNGEIIATGSKDKSIYTILPSADDMRVIGAEYGNFVDPILSHYKTLSSLFVPGTIANTAFEKVRLASRENRAIVLSTEEYKAMESVMNSARLMPQMLQEAGAGSKTQEAFAGKNKYSGFTSTGIGSLLVPFGSAVLAQTKLDEAGGLINLERFELMRQQDLEIEAVENNRQFYLSETFNTPKISNDPWLDTNTGPTKHQASKVYLSDDPWLDTKTGKTNYKSRVKKHKNSISKPILTTDPLYNFVVNKRLQTESLKLKSNNKAIDAEFYDENSKMQFIAETQQDIIRLGLTSEAADIYISTKSEELSLDKINELKNRPYLSAFQDQASKKATDFKDYINNQSEKLVTSLGYKKDATNIKGVKGFVRRSSKEINYNIEDLKSFGTYVHEFTHIVQDTIGLPTFGLASQYDKLSPLINSTRDYNDRYANLMEWQAYSVGTFIKQFDNPEFRLKVGMSARDWMENLTEAYASGDQKTILDFAEKWGFTNVIPNELKDYIPSNYKPGNVYTFSDVPTDTFEKFNVVERKINEHLAVAEEDLFNKLPTFSQRAKSLDVIQKIKNKNIQDSEQAEKYKFFIKEEILRPTYDSVVLSEGFKAINSLNNINAELESNSEPSQERTSVLSSTSTKDINSLGKNIINFTRRQKAALAFGINESLYEDFKNMKREAIETKNQILDFEGAAALSKDERKLVFDNLKDQIKQKRDRAYEIAGLDSETGNSLSNKQNQYSVKVPTEQDRYIYHAQALNYDALLTHVMIIGHEANIDPLSKEIVEGLQKRGKAFEETNFVLNSFEDKGGLSTFAGLGNKVTSLSERDMFVDRVINPGEGMASTHMKNMNGLASEVRGLGMSKEAASIKTQYANQQIDSTIEMYQKRLEDMQRFAVEREVHSNNIDENGKPIISESDRRKIDQASNDYVTNTNKMISYLQNQKSKLNKENISDQDIRNVFEDIDVKVIEIDNSNKGLAEVFRSPTPGGTDPRLHTYQVMQGVASLNKLSAMLSENSLIGGDPKMIYSTERGQTATMLASLGVITFGGGDFDGDPYTVIFHETQKLQSEMQKYKGKVDQHKLIIDNLNKAVEELKSTINSLDVTDARQLGRKDRLEERLIKLEKDLQDKQNHLLNDTQGLNDARNNLERQISDGHKGLQSRARKQIANYMGIDESFFVKKGEVMYDANGKVMINNDGSERMGINSEKTYDADSLFVFMEQGYKLMEGVESKGGVAITMMNNIDLLTGYRTEPKVFKDGEFLRDIQKGIVRTNGEISNESPAIKMLKDRVSSLQTSTQPLTDEQKQFLNSLKDAPDSHYKAYLEQFDSLTKEMSAAEARYNLENQQKAEDKQKAFSQRAFMNQWIGGTLFASMAADDTLSKFMTQGVGMTLSEGTLDMTLKVLGKAGGEILGKTYNTIIGTTFQDAPIISFGRQMLDSSSDLHTSTLTEFQRQHEGSSEKRMIAEQNALERGLERGSKKFDNEVTTELKATGYTEFKEYLDVTQKALLKSEGTQGFMKNIHQLLRDSIKLKDGDGDLLGNLQRASEEYDDLSKQIASNEQGENDIGKGKDLLRVRDNIVAKMSSKLGPGPGLKSLIDLDYLTNESSKTGLNKTEFEDRFLTGGIDSNRQMLNSYAESMTNLTESERNELRDPHSITEESGALLKVARNMTSSNIANMVTSFRMGAVAAEGRTEVIKGFARDHKAALATKLSIHNANNKPTSKSVDGIIAEEDQAGKYIREKYGIIESESSESTFDVNRQHKNALGAHLGLEENAIYNDDGTISKDYKNSLDKAAKKLNISSEEYTLMFDIHHETSRDQVGQLFGKDGNKMEQFTVMNLMRKNIARSMMDGQIPGSDASRVINESIGSEVLTTMAQLASTGKLDSQGIDIFAGMYKGVMGALLDATDGVVDVTRKSDGTVIQMNFSEMNPQQKSAYMTKLLHATMLGTATSDEKGFTRATSDEARHFTGFNSKLIGSADLILDDINGGMEGKLGNDFIDALDKAGANTLIGQQTEAYEALGEEYLRSSLDSDEQFDSVMRQYLPPKGNTSAGVRSDAEYRSHMKRKVSAQMRIRQEQDSKKYAHSRSRHGQGRSVMNRSAFMSNISTGALDQLSTTTGANVLDLFVPLALTAVGGAIQGGSVDGEQMMQLGGAMFTAFQYARTGTVETTNGSEWSNKRRLASASAVGGIFKFKNALAQQGDDNVGAAVASVAVQEITAAAFNTIATPWLSKNIAEHGLGVRHAPALTALDMKKYQAGQQLAGNLGASVISAVSSTIISGLFMRGVESMSQGVGEAIQSFLPAVQAVSQVNEAIARRRQQEAAYEDFSAETDGSEEEVKDYMVMTDSTYDPNDYSSIMDLQEAQEIEPSNDGSLSISLLG